MPKDKLKVGTSEDVLVKAHGSIGLSTPKKYNVVFYNDDYTPVDFVISLLVDIFHHQIDSAQEITTLIHSSGQGIAGTYTFEIAEQKPLEAIAIARAEKHPLQVKLEQAKDT
jgi:ATP-dependent Clp protease adaptor protein ClpS